MCLVGFSKERTKEEWQDSYRGQDWWHVGQWDGASKAWLYRVAAVQYLQ